MALIDDFKQALKTRLGNIDPQSGGISDKITDIYAEEIDGFITALELITAEALWQTKSTISDYVDTGVVSVEHIRQVNGSSNSRASNGQTQVNGSGRCEATAVRSQVNASLRAVNDTNNSSVWGFSASGDPSVLNQTARIESETGIGRFRGGTTTGGFDFAEYFESESGEAIPDGTIVSLSGYQLVLANGGDFVGVISATAGMIGNAAEFCWSGRYLRNEFGAYEYEEIPDPDYELKDNETEADRPLIRVKKENPDYQADKEYVSRENRPEWNVVALLGQVYVRIDNTADVGDYLEAENGIGTKSALRTNLRVMKITKPFDGKYGIAFCLLK